MRRFYPFLVLRDHHSAAVLKTIARENRIRYRPEYFGDGAVYLRFATTYEQHREFSKIFRKNLNQLNLNI